MKNENLGKTNIYERKHKVLTLCPEEVRKVQNQDFFKSFTFLQNLCRTWPV